MTALRQIESNFAQDTNQKVTKKIYESSKFSNDDVA
jgi:hypothetical protein